MRSSSSCVGVLLAGGSASRFGGRPKGLATVDGIRIADRAIAALRDATDSMLVVSNDARAARWFPELPIVADASPGMGPLAGIRSALLATRRSAIIVLAWDMPFVVAPLLRELRTVGESGSYAVVPTLGDPPRAEPLCAYYSADTLEVCERLLAAGERRAAALWEVLPPPTRQLDESRLSAYGDPARLLLSVDSPEVLASIGGVPPAE